jgi:RNA polymerase sigma factor (sigma-70 family)
MDDVSSPFVARILECEAAIVRMRAAIRAGRSNTDQVADDFELVRSTAAPMFVKFARSIDWISPTATEEALEAMDDRLLQDIWSDTFPSMETGFGSYLKTMPLRIIQRIRRKNTAGDGSSSMQRLDAPIGEDGMLLHEAVSDPQTSADMDALADRDALMNALDQIGPMERQAVVLRSQGFTNNDVADQLGVSAATATRIYQRGTQQLRRLLEASQE